MKAFKKVFRVSKNHEIKIKIPQSIHENDMIEMILITRRELDRFNQKILELKEAVKDKLFLADMKNTSEDFKLVDLKNWE